MLTTLVLSILLPATFAVVLVLATSRPWLPSSQGAIARAGIALAPGVAVWTTHVVVAGWPALPPTSSTGWLLALIGAASAWGALDGAAKLPTATRLLARLVLSTAAPILVLRSLIEHSWSGGQSALWIGLTSAAIFAVWTALEELTRRVRGLSLPLALTIVAGGAGAVLALSHTALLAQLLGGVAAATGVVFALAVWRPDTSIARSLVPPVVLALAGASLGGVAYADMPPWSAALLALSLLMPWLAQIPMLAAPAWRGVVVRTLSTLIVVSFAALVAYRSNTSATADAGYQPSLPAASDSASGDDAPAADDGYDEDYGY